MNINFWKRKTVPVGPRPAYFVAPKILTDAEQSRQNLERLLALAGVGDSNPVWKTLTSYADEHARNEQESALAANLSNEARQYNAGRAASALDFALAVRDLRTQANAEAKKLSGKDT